MLGAFMFSSYLGSFAKEPVWGTNLYDCQN